MKLFYKRNDNRALKLIVDKFKILNEEVEFNKLYLFIKYPLIANF